MPLPLTYANVLQPDWRVAPRVRALITTRNGGVSQPPRPPKLRRTAALPYGGGNCQKVPPIHGFEPLAFR